MSVRAWIELLLLSLIWGGSFLAMRIAQDDLPVFTVVLHRVGWAMLILWIVVALLRLPVPRDPRIWGALLLMGIFNNVIPFTLIVWGQETIETGLAAILNASTAIFGVILAAVIFADERLTPRRLTGVILGFIGVSAAIGLQAFASFDIRSLAQLALIGTSISYAVSGVWARYALRGLPPQVAAAGMLTGSTLVMLPLVWVVEGPPSLNLAADTWLAIAYYSAISTSFAYLLYYRVLGMAGAGNLLLCTLLVAPVAIVLGALFRNEALGLNAWIGFGILAVGLLILDGRILRPGHRPARDRPER